MSSKMVSGLYKLGQRVASNMNDSERNQKAINGLIERCSDVVPEGTTSLTLEDVQFYLGQQIRFEITQIRNYDNTHLGGIVDASDDRSERDQALTEVYERLLYARQAFESIHGSGSGNKLLGPATEVPRDPVRLYQTAERCQQWLRDAQREMPTPRIAGFPFDREALAASLDEPLARLGRAIVALPNQNRHSVDTLDLKLKAMARLDKLTGQSARLLEAFYDLAGMTFASDRVRPSSHQTKSKSSSEPEPESQDQAEEAAADNADSDSETQEESAADSESAPTDQDA